MSTYVRKPDTEINAMNFDDAGQFVETKFNEMKAMKDREGGLKALDKDGVEEFNTREAELADGRKRWTALRAVDDAFNREMAEHAKSHGTVDRLGIPFNGGGPGGGGDGANLQPFKSVGELFTESAAYKSLPMREDLPGIIDSSKINLKNRGVLQADIPGITIKSISDVMDGLKATMTTSAGWPTYPTQFARGPVLTPQRTPVVADLIPQTDTTQPSIIYWEETVFTPPSNADMMVAEGGLKPEAELKLEMITQAVKKIAVTLPVTDEQLADVPQVRAYIDNRLTLMVKLAEEFQLLHGDGTGQNLLGFHEKDGIGQTTRGAEEDNPDAILRAITAINSTQGFARASGVVLNPEQWMAIRLLRTKTGEYIWGHPALVGPATVWGLPVIDTPAETAGQGLVGDFQAYSHISRRIGITIAVGYINDDFRRDIQRIRMEERLNLEIYRALAFNEVLSMNNATPA